MHQVVGVSGMVGRLMHMKPGGKDNIVHIDSHLAKNVICVFFSHVNMFVFSHLRTM